MKTKPLPTVREMLKIMRDGVVNTPVLDSSQDWTDLIEQADKVLAQEEPEPRVIIECSGGLVRCTHSSVPMSVDVLDEDEEEEVDNYPEEKERLVKLRAELETLPYGV